MTSNSSEVKPKKSPKKTAEDYSGAFVGEPFVCQRYGISRVTAWKWRRKGFMPAPVELAPHVVRWRLADLLEWEKSRQAA
jgi:predicted DNA-binding transcriptional regulator AlpA